MMIEVVRKDGKKLSMELCECKDCGNKHTRKGTRILSTNTAEEQTTNTQAEAGNTKAIPNKLILGSTGEERQ